MKRTRMDERELKRAAVLSRGAERGWTLAQAAEGMEVSYRQGETIVETLSSGGGSGVGKWECGAVEPREAEEFTAAGAGAVPQGV